MIAILWEDCLTCALWIPPPASHKESLSKFSICLSARDWLQAAREQVFWAAFQKYGKCEGVNLWCCRGYRVATFIGVEECSYKRVIQGYCIYKLSDGLPVAQCHLAGSKPQILFFIHPSVTSLTPVMDFCICIGPGIVDLSITSDMTLQLWERGRTIFFTSW